MKESRCIQESLGSCTGCPIQEIVILNRKTLPRAEEHVLIEKVQTELCPEGNIMQIPTRQEQPIL